VLGLRQGADNAAAKRIVIVCYQNPSHKSLSSYPNN
jgi:hypothetical protein